MSVLKGFLCNSVVKNVFLNSLDTTNVRTLKSALKIKWVRPVKQPSNHPANSGDKSAITKYPKGTLMLAFEASKELQTADENVKKIFQLDMLTTPPKLVRYKAELREKVQRNPLDDRSHEVFIANLTAQIRFLQEHMEKKPKDKKNKVRLQHLIDRRKRQLTHLRRWDYPRFEWLLTKLDIVYRPYPDQYDQITRKKSLTQLTTLHCEQLKEKKIAEYRKKMDETKVPFLEKKLEKLRWIRQQETELKLESSVTEGQVAACEQLLQATRLEIQALPAEGKNYERVIHPYTLEKYDPESLRKAEKKTDVEES